MDQYVESRREFLRAIQNPDGGWGFFPRKQSWLEPSAYAILALHADPDSQAAVDRAWTYLRGLQMADGSWQPCAQVGEPHWTTALGVTLHCVRNIYDDSFRQGVSWLLQTSGSENNLLFRAAHFLRPRVVEMDPSLKAWPWRPGTASWIEPTAHALVALKKASASYGGALLKDRVALGQRMILERRCHDGGWNYGNRKVLGAELPSYPETTALALLGLAGDSSLDLASPLALAKRMWSDTRSPLARAWLGISLKSHGAFPAALSSSIAPAPPDTMLAALEAIGATGAMA